MKVLITGANGFVGKHLSRYLKSKGFDTIGLDITDGTDLKGDITNKDYIFNELSKHNFDSVIHLAALADIKKTTEDPYSTYNVNCFGTLNLLELAARKNVERFLYASSANVYGVPAERPATEATPFNPRLPYDYSKVVSETLVRSYFVHKKLKIAITRSWLLFGEGEPQTRAFPRFVRACLANQKIPLFNSGQDVTDPTHAQNYGRVAELILNKDTAIGESFNVGSGNKMSVRDMAEQIKKVTNSSSELELLPPRTEFEKDPQISYPSIDKLRKKLGFEPIVSFDEGVKRVVEWIKTTG
ncbi:MAG: GDP-mannose 4,6-dehydratase [Nitrososphaerota archaeon]|nr:GDP-mannose 4,6-dehydratase [Nitrososphaerota archaeon]